MKVVYCAKCGTRLQVYNKAVRHLGRVIQVVDYHSCPPEPVELDLTPIQVVEFSFKGVETKFVQKLDDLGKTLIPQPGDRRSSDHVKQQTSAAPVKLIEQLRSLKGLPNDREGEPDE